MLWISLSDLRNNLEFSINVSDIISKEGDSKGWLKGRSLDKVITVTFRSRYQVDF